MLSEYLTKNRVIILQAIAILVLSGLLARSCHKSYTGTPLPSVDASVPSHDVVTEKPVQALDKKELAKVADIPTAIVKDEKKEVLATGKTDGDSGTSTVAAVLDKTTGRTAIIEKRPFMELMNRHELGLEYGMTDAGVARGTYYHGTLLRIGDFYGGLSLEALQLQTDLPHVRWSATMRVGYRW